jgi:hypothetical protein
MRTFASEKIIRNYFRIVKDFFAFLFFTYSHAERTKKFQSWSEGEISAEPQFATYTLQEQIAEQPQGSVSKKFTPERLLENLLASDFYRINIASP